MDESLVCQWPFKWNLLSSTFMWYYLLCCTGWFYGWIPSVSVTIQMRLFKQHFHVVLFILLYKALNFKSVEEALVLDQMKAIDLYCIWFCLYWCTMNLKSRTEHANSIYLLCKVVQLLNKFVFDIHFVAIQTKLPIISTFVWCSEIVFIK